MTIEVYFSKEIKSFYPEADDAAIDAAAATVGGYEDLESIPPLTQHVVAFIEFADTVTDELKAAVYGTDPEAVNAAIDATALPDPQKEYLKGRVALDEFVPVVDVAEEAPAAE